jgi:hypothetical protein
MTVIHIRSPHRTVAIKISENRPMVWDKGAIHFAATMLATFIGPVPLTQE